jgi:hypothetical protein
MSKFSSEIVTLLSLCLNCKEPYEIRCLNNEYEIAQLVGGTRGADYIYVRDNEFFVNIKNLPKVKLTYRERLSCKRVREIYRIPKEILENKLVLSFSFGRESGYPYIHLCTSGREVIRCCPCDVLEKDDELAPRIASMFRPLGGEEGVAEWYLHVVPKMSKEILGIATRSGARGIHSGERAERLHETLHNPGFSLLMSMVLPTAQRRIQSLSTKISHVLKLFVVAKVVETLDGTSLTDKWTIEFTTNRPLAVIKSRITGKDYTIFYQPSILPHILPGFVENAPKHLVPDIVVFEGRVEGASWGELYKLIERGATPKIVVEVKTGLGYLKWEEPSYVFEQVGVYRELLKPGSMALISLKTVDPALKAKLRALGVAIFENFANEFVQAEFKKYVVKALM